MTPFDGIPRLTRHPSDRQIVPPLAGSQYVRLWLYRRLNDWLRRVLTHGVPTFQCECDETHPHPDWPA